LDALRHQTTEAPTCVIDNGSTDHTAELLEREFPEVRHLRLDRNYGFGRALNRGVDGSSAEVVVFLNNDAVPDRRFVEEVAAAHARSGADMVAACLRQPSGEVDSLGVEVDTSLNAYDLAHGEQYGDPSHSALDPLAPTGGAAGFRRDAFLAVGGFDEEIFAYLEDVDLGIRMRMEDMSCVLAYDAYAWHRHAGTLGSGSAEKNRLLGKSRGYLLWKYGANLNYPESMRALASDAIVYAGKAVVDRNLAALRGRVQSATAGRSRPRPAADPRFARVPLVSVPFTGGLRRRLARRA
jgi:GT2 family glycosyltransferase